MYPDNAQGTNKMQLKKETTTNNIMTYICWFPVDTPYHPPPPDDDDDDDHRAFRSRDSKWKSANTFILKQFIQITQKEFEIATVDLWIINP